MRPTKLATVGIAFGLALLLNGPASAQTVNFDDLTGACGAGIPSGYMGFNWSGWKACDVTAFGGNTTGIANGISSGNVAAFGTNLRVTRASPFQFLSVFLNPAWMEGLTVTVTGLLNNANVFTTVLTNLNASTSGSLASFGYWVDELQFVASGGTGSALHNSCTDPNNLPGFCRNFMVDDLTYVTPEPTTVALLGTGLLVMGFYHRRRKRSLEV